MLVKVDVGFHRCGIDPAADDAVAMIRGVAGLPGLRFKGLLSHAGHAYHAHSENELCGMAKDEAATLRDLVERCRRDGIQIEEVSAGATPPARFSLQQDGFTEFRPGNYVYFDRTQVALGAATLDDCALTVMARVVSKPAADRIIFDSGSKTLTNDGARGFTPAPGFGVVIRDDGTPDTNLLIERLSEEHATVKVAERINIARAGRSRADCAESFVRGVEPRRSGVAARRQDSGADADCRARKEHVVSAFRRIDQGG